MTIIGISEGFPLVTAEDVGYVLNTMNKTPDKPLETSEELSPSAGYAAWAAFYDNDGNPLIALEGPAVKRLFGPISGRRVLDVGCGTGRHTLSLVEAGARVTALDQSQEMMELARRKLAGQGVEWVRHALPANLPFSDGAFELVVMGLVAEHVVDLVTVMKELARVTRSKGRCIVSALHPERTAEGQRARFIDPGTGLRRPIATIHREPSEYREIADLAGWRMIEESTLIVPPSIIDQYPRAAKYVGLPLGWVGCWERADRF